MPFTERNFDACAVGLNCCFISDNWISEFSERKLSLVTLLRSESSFRSSVILYIGVSRLLLTPGDRRWIFVIVLNKGIIQWFLMARKISYLYIESSAVIWPPLLYFGQVLVWLFGCGFISGCPMCMPLDHPISFLNQSKEVLSDADLTLVKILVPRNFSFNSSLIRVLKYFKLGMYAFLRLM